MTTPDRAVIWCLVLTGLIILALTVLLGAQGRRIGPLASGRIQPTVQESQECIFPIGQGAALLLHPNGEPCRIMRELEGLTGVLEFMVDNEQTTPP